MPRSLLLAVGAGLALSSFVIIHSAEAQTCEDLWYQRNEIYKAQGYCFRTERAIRAFGNAGCVYDNVEDVPLSTSQRRQIADIQRVERTHGCPR
ncbi:YARHG domain-containing protein [Bosea sp. NPDC055594]